MKKVIIKAPVAASGKHYEPGGKAVSLSDDDARYLIVRSKAKPADNKKQADEK